MDLFNLPSQDKPAPTERELKESIVTSDLTRIERMASSRVNDHISSYIAFWDNKQITPDEYLEILGPRALKWLMTAKESVRNATELATIGGLDLEKELPSTYREPRRAFIPGMNPAAVSEDNPYGLTGYVTLAPAPDGYDAWGKLIPIEIPPPPPPVTEEEPTEEEPLEEEPT